MIKSIEIKNFKSIKSKYFPLRNLNVLMGLNGTGKSSFIQFLLALRQSRNRAYGELGLNGDYVEIGTTRDALYQYAKDEHLATQIVFSENNELNFTFDYNFNSDKFTANNIERNLYDEPVKRGYDEIFRDESLYNDNFQYLKAGRQEPQTINRKAPTLVGEKRNIGNKGEYAAHYIELFPDQEVVIDSLVHEKSKSFDKVTGEEFIVRTLKKQLDLWMGEISPNIHIQTTEVSSDLVKLEYSYKQRNLGSTNRFKPENVGFGITYGLPVVLALLKANPGDLIIIENPESHIHPRGQAELGKMMALAAAGGVQIIVETHSDHIINGIRVAVKEERIKAKDAIIYYFDKAFEANEQYSSITNVEIDRNGELSEYPENMLDEWNDQLMKLL